MALDPLGDNISSVDLIDVMGNDLRVVNAARVSFAKWKDEFDESDKKLLKYLAAHNHWTPFSHPQLCFRITAPLFVAREWFRHTVGFTRNEVSGRYVTTEKKFFVPKQWRLQSKSKKQGSDGDIANLDNAKWKAKIKGLNAITLYQYNQMVTQGIAGEQARMILPQSMYTSWIETGSLYAYARLCKLRISPDAQQECRNYAEAVDELILPCFPNSWSVLREG